MEVLAMSDTAVGGVLPETLHVGTDKFPTDLSLASTSLSIIIIDSKSHSSSDISPPITSHSSGGSLLIRIEDNNPP